MIFFVAGNVGRESAIKIVDKARHILDLKMIEKEDLSDVRCVALEKGKSYLYEYDEENHHNDNSCLVSFF
jgi:hypothetical protein